MNAAIKTLAAALGVGACLLASCGGAQSKTQAQLVAITAGCQAALDIERDAGEAGATSQTERGCRASLHAWEGTK